MITLVIDSSAVLAAFRRAGGVVLERADMGLAQGALLIQRDAVQRVPKATGWAQRNIHVGRIAPLVHEVISRSLHAGFIERGTNLFGPTKTASGNRMLPDGAVSDIANWIRVKGITPRPGVTPEQLPWLIARKIARDGTRAQPYMEPARVAMEPQVVERVTANVRQGLIDAGLPPDA